MAKPSQPGMIGGLTGAPMAKATGPGTPTPIPRTSAAVRSTRRSSSMNCSCTRSSTASGPCEMSISSGVSASGCAARSLTARREWVAPRSAASTTPASRLKASTVGGRPPVDALSPAS